MKRLLGAVGAAAALIGLVVGVERVSAHHSATMYDHAQTMTIKGKVVELRWVNPHVSLTVKGLVGDSKVEEEWVMEMTSPGNLVRAGGWSRNVVKAGDDVTVDFSPLRDNTLRGGALKKVTVLASGLSYTANLRAQEMPGLE
jgi:Family of unknown function (DUF6152)